MRKRQNHRGKEYAFRVGYVAFPSDSDSVFNGRIFLFEQLYTRVNLPLPSRKVSIDTFIAFRYSASLFV